jgi:hypothetical protein
MGKNNNFFLNRWAIPLLDVRNNRPLLSLYFNFLYFMLSSLGYMWKETKKFLSSIIFFLSQTQRVKNRIENKKSKRQRLRQSQQN